MYKILLIKFKIDQIYTQRLNQNDALSRRGQIIQVFILMIIFLWIEDSQDLIYR